ncbi:chromate transport protein ChrA [Halalkalibacter oceani]
MFSYLLWFTTVILMIIHTYRVATNKKENENKTAQTIFIVVIFMVLLQNNPFFSRF